MSSRTRKRRKQTRRSDRRSRWPSFPPIGNIAHLRSDAPQVWYEISHDPLPDGPIDLLPPESRERVLRAGERVIDGATDQVPVLERLVEEFPDCPPVYNYLACAYRLSGDEARSDQITEEAYRRFPEYLFGMCGYANLLLSQGRFDEVTAILQNRFGLHLWIKHRSVYHVSEFVAFNGLMVRYFVWKGDLEIAERYRNMLLDVAPDHPQTRIAVRFIESAEAFLAAELVKWAKREKLRAWLHADDE